MIEAVEKRLEYFSGKRAESAEAYFRYKACEADRSMLREFLEEACGWIDAVLGVSGRGYTVRTDEISFLLRHNFDGEERERSLSTLFRSILIKRVIWHWLRLAGYPEAESAYTETMEMLGLILAELRFTATRPIFPDTRNVPPL